MHSRSNARKRRRGFVVLPGRGWILEASRSHLGAGMDEMLVLAYPLFAVMVLANEYKKVQQLFAMFKKLGRWDCRKHVHVSFPLFCKQFHPARINRERASLAPQHENALGLLIFSPNDLDCMKATNTHNHYELLSLLSFTTLSHYSLTTLYYTLTTLSPLSHYTLTPLTTPPPPSPLS